MVDCACAMYEQNQTTRKIHPECSKNCVREAVKMASLDPATIALIEATIAKSHNALVSAAKEAATKVADQLIQSNIDSTASMKKKLEDKIKIESTPFNAKGNKKMFEHNATVLETLRDANEALEKNDLQKVKESLKEGEALLIKRMKVIRLADREDWLVANGYISDELASDTDDEKRLNRAIKSADSKRSKIKK